MKVILILKLGLSQLFSGNALRSSGAKKFILERMHRIAERDWPLLKFVNMDIHGTKWRMDVNNRTFSLMNHMQLMKNEDRFIDTLNLLNNENYNEVVNT